jgi:hypothetical protein
MLYKNLPETKNSFWEQKKKGNFMDRNFLEGIKEIQKNTKMGRNYILSTLAENGEIEYLTIDGKWSPVKAGFWNKKWKAIIGFQEYCIFEFCNSPEWGITLRINPITGFKEMRKICQPRF